MTLVDTDRSLGETTETDTPHHAHIVKTKPGESAQAIVLTARVTGTPITALCGFVWVPSRNPESLPLCPKCEEIYNIYRSANDGLHERPIQ